MGTGRTDEFRKDAVRIALTSGLSRRQVADDLGVGLVDLEQVGERSTADTDVVSAEDRELARENERLRRLRTACAARRRGTVLKKATQFFASLKAVRFSVRAIEQRGTVGRSNGCAA